MFLLTEIVSGSVRVISLLIVIAVSFTALLTAFLSSASVLTTISEAPSAKRETLLNAEANKDEINTTTNREVSNDDL
jgi:hypothetical protein